jgi:hypothetical protein
MNTLPMTYVSMAPYPGTSTGRALLRRTAVAWSLTARRTLCAVAAVPWSTAVAVPAGSITAGSATCSVAAGAAARTVAAKSLAGGFVALTSARRAWSGVRPCASVSRAAFARGRRRAVAASPATPSFTTGELNAVTIAQRSRTGRDHLIALGQTADDFDELLTLGTELHGPENCQAVQVLKHTASSTEIGDRVNRHDERVLLGGRRDPDAGIHARLQAEISIGNLDLNGGGASGRIEDRGDSRNAALKHLSGERVYFDLGPGTRVKVLEVALDDVDHETYAADVYDIDHR